MIIYVHIYLYSIEMQAFDCAEIAENEREEDSLSLLRVLRSKIDTVSTAQIEKMNLMRAQLSQLIAVEEDNNVGKVRLQEKSKAFIESSEKHTECFLLQLQQKEEKAQLTLVRQLDHQLASLSDKMAQMEESRRQAVEQACEGVKESVLDIYEKIENHRGELIDEMERIEREVGEQLEKLKEGMEKRKKIQEKCKEEVGNNINEIWEDLEKCIYQEKKNGEATYESLLTLIEDSCCKIERYQIR